VNPTPPELLAEQIAYYRAIAGEYDTHSIPLPGVEEMLAALESFDASGDVLELACGPGTWTERLLRRASSLTAVDASPEMIALARSKVGDEARFIHADLFSWAPDRRYDAVFFGFWLSHVPMDRFETFWALVADALAPEGRVFFVDDAFRTPEELIEGESSSTIERKLHDGTAFRAVKVPHRAADLQSRLGRLGWDITVREVGPLYWGTGTLART
jgi:demethylmenaquinone methyltransferase/2-methoxy-6-polyprenyl-1,4-benzoquinol methylase